MVFSDDDLKRLKDNYGIVSEKSIMALLARLEMAEKLICCRDPFNRRDRSEENAYKAWRKAAGK